jgi:hypothetical protein
MDQELLQFLPPGQKRSGMIGPLNEEVNRAIARTRANVARTSTETDRSMDRLVPQVFSAEITSATAQTPLSASRRWWTYQWKEVERDATGGTWSDVSPGRTNSGYGVAWNFYELSVDDDGGNTVTSTPVRLSIAVGRVVTMHIDPAGRPWFNEVNPVEICT